MQTVTKLQYFEVAQLMGEIRKILPLALNQEAEPGVVFMVALHHFQQNHNLSTDYKYYILDHQKYPRNAELLQSAVALVVEEEYVRDVLELLTTSLQWKN